jgi:hypothetical protein
MLDKELVTTIVIPGNSTDLYPLNGGTGGANINRFSFGSDLFYDYRTGFFYGLADRGPGGGTISYNTRVHKLSIAIDPNTGAASNFKIEQTIGFFIPAGTTLNGVTYAQDTPFNGFNPEKLNGNKAVLGASLDPEGFVVGANGNFFVADEYGPSVYEFAPTGRFVRALTPPPNLLPKQSDGNLNFVDGRGTITTGRQDNRGFEGLTISPDGTKLFGILQDPLVNEGSSNDGRRSNNLRIVRYDVATGKSDAQYIYPLETLADINARIPGTADDFSATSQGRNIGVSAIVAINDQEFLVLERDNRGIGVDPTANLPIGSKQIFKINITGATDVSNISLAGTNTLPPGVTPVTKTQFLDIAKAIQNPAQGVAQSVPEKIEGLALGPQLADGSFALLLATDNDFSVTQNASGNQLDVYTDGVERPIDSPAPANGATLLPSYLYAFKTTAGSLDVTSTFDFSAANYTVNEGNTPGFAQKATVRVTRRGDLTGTDTVKIQLNDGTATGGNAPTPAVDYDNKPIEVTFNPGETFKDVLIPIAGDGIPEPNETVNLSLISPSANGVIGTKQPQAILTIKNNAAPQLTGTAAVLDGQEDTAYTITKAQLLQGFTDAEGHPISIKNVKVDNTALTPDAAGNYVFTPAANAFGKYVIDYELTDGLATNASC